MDKIIYIEEQYDKIYRYCYFRLRSREAAEDITQETFLRFLKNTTYQDTGQGLQYLYSIARNLCVNEYHRPKAESLSHEIETDFPEDALLTSISLKTALEKLSQEERELLLLRYANEVPVTVISRMLGLSRFAVHRKISGIFAFETPFPLSKKSFLQSLPQPRCDGRTFVMSQIGYIPLWVWGVSLATFLIALLSAHYVRKDTLGILSACIPFVASCAVAENEKSIVYRMAELEKASLFSLKSVTLARLGIIGTSHLILLCLLSPLAGTGNLSSTLRSGIYLLLPYLLTSWLSLLFTRKLHGRDSTYLCMGTALAVSGLCVMSQTKFHLLYRPEYFHGWMSLSAVLAALTALAYYQTIQRTEELSWNLF